ncbi:MAG: hypothetical protein HYY24_04565 [Verrucomicrobia bacterium]|nr:hypothetical protein [Verrucomicrobiota bacterium]
MRFELSGCCFRITIELFWLGPEPVFRRYRIAARDGAIRRKLLHSVRERLRD